MSSSATWSRFAAAAPDLAAFGALRLDGRVAYLATIRRDGSPRVHPVSPFFGESNLFVYMEPTSPKVLDLRRDARCALHCGVEDNDGGEGEFFLSGHAVEVLDTEARDAAFAAARAMSYGPHERHVLFELRVDGARATVYEGDHPRRSAWHA